MKSVPESSPPTISFLRSESPLTQAAALQYVAEAILLSLFDSLPLPDGGKPEPFGRLVDMGYMALTSVASKIAVRPMTVEEVERVTGIKAAADKLVGEAWKRQGFYEDRLAAMRTAGMGVSKDQLYRELWPDYRKMAYDYARYVDSPNRLTA